MSYSEETGINKGILIQVFERRRQLKEMVKRSKTGQRM